MEIPFIVKGVYLVKLMVVVVVVVVVLVVIVILEEARRVTFSRCRD